MKKIITIGREFGSGGRELGRRLAEELNIEYYDKEIITEISKHTQLSEEYVKDILEKKPHHLYPITIGHTIAYVNDYQLKQAQTVYQAQWDILKDLATKSDCVIVGRCADYILSEFNPYRIFVYADIDSRLKRYIKRSPESEKVAEKTIKKEIVRIDKERAQYYHYYTGKDWGSKENYDLCINTTNKDIKEIAKIIAKLFE